MLFLEDHVPCGDGNPREAGHLDLCSQLLFSSPSILPSLLLASFPKLLVLFLIPPLGPRLDIPSPGCAPGMGWFWHPSFLCFASLGLVEPAMPLSGPGLRRSVYDEGPLGPGVDATMIGGGQMGGGGSGVGRG